MDWELIKKLMDCFPNSYINSGGEFVAEGKSNTYFILKDCKSELDIKCKIIEWFSRPAQKTQPYASENQNKKFHKFMLNGINQFLGTKFSEDDMKRIYTYLGNAVNHERTVAFVMSGYDMKHLQKMREKRSCCPLENKDGSRKQGKEKDL